ncbi:transposase [Streptococcus pneumoniae]|nr:transposase [Streptococcus pneumoniae]
MYEDEAGFSRISKLGSCWSPIGVGPHVHSHYIREFRYCYGAVDAHTGESFFLIAGGCNTEWMNAFLEELSQAYPFIPPYTPEMNPLNKCGKRFVNVDLRIKPFELWKMSYKD